MTFLEELSTILGVPLRKGKIRQYAGLLDREGRMTKRVQLDMLLLISEKLAELDTTTKDTIIDAPTATALDEMFSPTQPLTKEEEMKIKRQENMKKAQEARRRKYELKRAATQQNA